MAAHIAVTGDPCGSSQSRAGPVPFFRKLTGDCRVNAVANSVRKDTDTACHPAFEDATTPTLRPPCVPRHVPWVRGAIRARGAFTS